MNIRIASARARLARKLLALAFKIHVVAFRFYKSSLDTVVAASDEEVKRAELAYEAARNAVQTAAATVSERAFHAQVVKAGAETALQEEAERKVVVI